MAIALEAILILIFAAITAPFWLPLVIVLVVLSCEFIANIIRAFKSK